MEWYRVTFKAFHSHTKVPVVCEAIVASEVDGEDRPVTLKADVLLTLKNDYDLAGLHGYHDVKVEKHHRKSYITYLEKEIR
jgi:hypothetical protein